MLKLTTIDVNQEKSRLIVIPICEDVPIQDQRRFASLARRASTAQGFEGKPRQKVVLYRPPRSAVEQVVLVGLGKAAEVTAEALRSLAGRAVKDAISSGFAEICFAVPTARKLPLLQPEDLLCALMEGAYLANHRFSRYKQEETPKELTEIHFHATPQTVRRYARLSSRVAAICDGTLLARDWVDTPANDKLPERLAADIAARARAAGLSVTLFDHRELHRKKFGALLAVAAGSRNRPRLLALEYNGGKNGPPVALVGKGVTFDTGGINLKTSASLKQMKIDMAGAAAVAATMIQLSRWKPVQNVVAILPLVENMPSGSAIRPGDIVTSLDGKSVEIGNTDAEGRLILIDAITHAIRTYRPRCIIDLATLTGACMVALGDKIAGLFSNDDGLAETIMAASRRTGERCWRMPLPDDYRSLLESDLADISNISSSRWGGAIAAALFLEAFVQEVPWAHIDIAGTAVSGKDIGYCPKGGSGFGVRLLAEVLRNL